MNPRFSKAADSLRWVQRRHIFFLLVWALAMYLVLFHDIHSIVNSTAEALTSSSKNHGTNPTEVVQQPPPAHINQPPLVAEHQDEEPYTVDDGTLPPDLVPLDEYLAVCLSVKDQARDMVEFLNHHYHHHGIRRFYIMDDGSDPPLSSYKYPGIPRSTLTFTFQPRAKRVKLMQTKFYRQCLEKYSSQHRWIAFIDTDEFFDTPGNETLREILESFDGDDHVGALGVNWQSHTSNNHLKRQKSVRQAFTTCIADELRDKKPGGTMNKHIKSIVKTKVGIPRRITPHKCEWKKGPVTVGEDGKTITHPAFRYPISRNRIGLHHYVVKSKEEYDEKRMRGSGMSNHKDTKLWKEVEFELDHVDCPEMAMYHP